MASKTQPPGHTSPHASAPEPASRSSRERIIDAAKAAADKALESLRNLSGDAPADPLAPAKAAIDAFNEGLSSAVVDTVMGFEKTEDAIESEISFEKTGSFKLQIGNKAISFTLKLTRNNEVSYFTPDATQKKELQDCVIHILKSNGYTDE